MMKATLISGEKSSRKMLTCKEYKMTKCNLCGNDYTLGYDGIVDGCDVCLSIIRDNQGYFYLPDEQTITLEDVVTGENEERARPNANL